MAGSDGRRAELVEQALEMDASNRIAFLDAICGNDAALKADIQRLLALAEESADAFLEGNRDTTVPLALAPGNTIDRYVIETLIGVGGMGAVYQARDPKISRRVAVKVLRGAHTSPEQQERFLAEVRALGSLRHERVVRVYDAGEHEGHPYFVTELLEGEDLGKAIAADHCGDLARRLEIAIQAAEALRAVHAAGFAHRDVKPSNLFVTMGGEVKLLDFGIARALGPTSLQPTLVCGTPRYMAPEQVRGEPTTLSTDVFAFGLMLFELISGRPAYCGNPADALEQVLHEPVPIAQLAEICPPAVIEIICEATAKEPAERISDFDEVLRRLRAVRFHSPQRRAILTWGGGLTALVATGLLGLVWLRSSPVENAPAQVPQPVASAASQVTSVELGLLLDGPASVASPLTTASFALRNSDRFRLVATPSTSGHFYVFAAPVDGSSLHVLFPSPTSYTGSSRLEGNQTTRIPEATWFELERRAGRERLWVAWSRTPYAPFEDARQWANKVDRGRVADPASRARLESSLAGRSALDQADDGRLVLRGGADLLIGVLEVQHR